jgi:chitin synthase
MLTLVIQADEAQHGHYNDGYSPYDTGASPYDRPYDPSQRYGTVLPDPFVTPPPGPFADPHDEYAHPYGQSPPMPAADYMHPHFNPDPIAHPSSTTIGQSSSYQLHDDGDDPGDMPLLRRDGSRVSTYSMPHVPGEYDEPVADNRSENNIRYGRIPQRVPRRYKTIKKVE